MSDESQLQITPKDSDSSLSLSKARSSLIARGRRDAAVVTQAVKSPHEAMAKTILKTLEEFGASGVFNAPSVGGPSFIRFFVLLSRDAEVGALMSVLPELQIRMNLARVPIMSMNGGSVAFDVVRPDPEVVLFGEIRDQIPAGDPLLGSTRLPVGVDLHRRLVLADLSEPRHGHFLVAGTNSRGRSEWLRMAAASLIATNTPKTLRLMLIDPKRVTFEELDRSPYLLDGGPLLHTPEEAIGGLDRLVELMEERYRLFAERGVTDLDTLTRQGVAAPPRIVFFLDEYWSLVARKAHRDAVELAINQLGARARAAGIHLIIAMGAWRQEMIRGSWLANLPARVCLNMGKDMSRLLLGQNGAEGLLRNGDLLFKDIGEPIHLQAPLLPEEERKALFRGDKL
jgi:DNA segregation ATPase FtsK/SpoIIIE, S-DNA-T family